MRMVTCVSLVSIAMLGISACAVEGGTPRDTVHVAVNAAVRDDFSPLGSDALIVTQLGGAETLVRVEESGDVEPWLAQSWTAPSSSSVMFTLRDGVRFHDGETLDAAAVARSLNAVFSSPWRPAALGNATLKAQATSDTTVTVTSDQPDPVLVRRLALPGTMILSPRAYSRKDDVDRINALGHGTGPYVLSRPVGTEMTLRANDTYWGDTPTLPTITAALAPEVEPRLRVMRSTYPAVVLDVPPSSAAQLHTDNDSALRTRPSHRRTLLYLNTRDGLFSRPDVRAAAIDALSPQELYDDVYSGYAQDPKGTLFDSGEKKQSGDVDTHSFDESATRDVTSGPHAVSLATWIDHPVLPAAAERIAQQLRRAGFEVELTVLDAASLESRIRTGRFDMVLGSRNLLEGTGDPLYALSTEFSCAGRFNASRLCDADVDAALEEALALRDRSQRLAAAEKIANMVVSTGAVVPIAAEEELSVQRGVSGVIDDPYGNRLIDSHLRLADSRRYP